MVVILAWLLCFLLLHGGTCAAVRMNKKDSLSPSTLGVCESRVTIFGYDCEEHIVTTEDGYILSIQRIPNGLEGANSGDSKIPVLLQHGVLTDGIIWLINSPNESLAFILADSGFDVWIANGRGTVYSRGHTSLSPDDSEYWDWSWDELVDYDLPSIFGYVHDETGGQMINYVGHSQGTLIALASFSEHKLLNMTRSAALLSPIAHLNHVTSPIAQATANSFLGQAVYWLGLYEFDPMGKVVQSLLQEICQQPGINCYDLMTIITGKNCCLNSSSLDVFLEHEPQPTSTKDMVQLAQMIRTGNIARYDYGNILENMQHYGQPTPPAYDMSGIPDDLPLFLSYGGQDALSDVTDVLQLLEDLKNHDKDKMSVQYISDYAHGDYVMATNAKKVVYDPLIAFFKLQ